MQLRLPSLLLPLPLIFAACGDDSGRNTGDDGADSISTLETTVGAETGSSDDNSTGDGDPSTGDGDPSTGDGDPSTGDGDPSTGDGDPSTGDGDPNTGDGDPDPCGGNNGLPVEKLIWIANSGQGTVSKIDTESGEELGRYRVRADGAGSPSRTSVNRFGDVAVANRLGGVAKVNGSISNCQESNGIPGIQTSDGSDFLPWGEDECLQWFTPIAANDNRPIAWTNGTFNQQSCAWEGVDVWTAWSNTAPGTAVVALLDGETGSIIHEVPIPDLPSPWSGWHGFYGAAVDSHDNVWLSQLQGSNPQQAWLVMVDRQTFEYSAYPVPGEGGYGMTVTSEGYVWLCGRETRRFNPQTHAWTSVPLLGGSVHTGGCMGDGNGILYRGGYAQVYGIDTLTMETVRVLDVGQAGDDFVWGVAVDFDGYVWGVPRNGTRAYKVDPDTNQIVHTFQGLVSAYTYSDMTGFALLNVEPG